MDFLQGLREELIAKRDSLQSRSEKIQVHLRQKDGPLSADWQEQATELENYEVMEALDDLGRNELQQIKEALIRMDNDTFGVCTACESEISEGRLKAIPFARICIECAEELEKQQKSR